MYKISVILLLSIGLNKAIAQRVTIEAYIAQFKDMAINEMKRSGVPASITLAQGILESENGNSDLVKKSNNHFGIKCKNTWTGETVTHDDDTNQECFRAYNNADESYRDHSDFLKANKRYSSLFALDPIDYEGWARGLKKAGYATNPKYPDLLISYIEQYDLQQYSLYALQHIPSQDIAIAEVNDNEKPVGTRAGSPSLVNDINTVSPEAEKVSSINNTPCVFVKKGTSLLLIANKNNISLSKLMDFNDLTEEGILSKDQFIFLHKKSRTGNTAYYIVQPGETVYDVAQATGIQLRYLLMYNHLDAGINLQAGTKLFLQSDVVNSADNDHFQKNKVHVVAPKEGLYAISKIYKVSIKQLKKWNKLVSDELGIGQKIIVSK